jgi:hypothetical protein
VKCGNGALRDHRNLVRRRRGGVADVPDLKSCSAFGDTPEVAVAEVRVAMEAWLATAREAGHPIPEAH